MPDTPRDPVRTRGRYVTTFDGRPSGVDERFVLGEIAPGAVRSRTTRVLSRPVARLESDARFDARGTSVAIRWVGSAAGAVREASAELVEDAGEVSAARIVEGTAYAVSRVRGRLDPLGHVTAGPLVLAAVGGLDVVEPDLSAPDDPAAFLAAVTTRRTAAAAGTAVVVVDGVEREGTSYLWSDGRLGTDAHVVIDAGGLLLRSRLTTADGLLEVVLAEVSGPWPEPARWTTG